LVFRGIHRAGSGRETEKAAALERARDCYARFGMAAQAARVAALEERSP
jgi:hypothetical protein